VHSAAHSVTWDGRKPRAKLNRPPPDKYSELAQSWATKRRRASLSDEPDAARLATNFCAPLSADRPSTAK
jgi:hypothetical protein